MEEFKYLIRAITLFTAILIYICIWRHLIKNWDKYMRTVYGYPCIEGLISTLYDAWIIIHIGFVAYIVVWAWT